MKKLKIVVSLLVVFAFCFGIYSLVNEEEYSYYLVMGDYISNNQIFDSKEVDSFSVLVGDYLREEKVVNEVNKGYLKNGMTSKQMLEMIEKGSYKIDDSNLVDLIKKSKYITITLGINDVINQVKYDSLSDELVYDKDVINNKIEVFKHNYHQILQEIKDINSDAKVLLVGCYSLYGDSSISDLINVATETVAKENDSYYIDVSDINDTYMYQNNELYLTGLGQEEISRKVISKIKQIEIS